MKTSALLTLITVIIMLTAQTRTEPSHVLANLALLATEPLVLVSKDLFINIVGLMLSLNINMVLYIVRYQRVCCYHP